MRSCYVAIIALLITTNCAKAEDTKAADCAAVDKAVSQLLAERQDYLQRFLLLIRSSAALPSRAEEKAFASTGAGRDYGDNEVKERTFEFSDKLKEITNLPNIDNESIKNGMRAFRRLCPQQ